MSTQPKIDLTRAEAHLRNADPVFTMLLERQTVEVPPARTDYFASLARTIIGQQISVASARATYGRFEAATRVDPARVYALTLALDEWSETHPARKVGLSRQKASYLHSLAEHFVDNPSVYDHLELLADDEVITELTAIKGIGVWSAQMFLIFTLLRPDVFAPLDIGVQNAMIRLYKLKKPLDLTALEAIAEPWRPHRSVALLHLWQSLYDTTLVLD